MHCNGRTRDTAFSKKFNPKTSRTLLSQINATYFFQLSNFFQNFKRNFSDCWWAGPDSNRRPSARQADVLTELDYRPFFCYSEMLSAFEIFMGFARCQQPLSGKRSRFCNVGIQTAICEVKNCRLRINEHSYKS
jgi:hypothetical protein